MLPRLSFAHGDVHESIAATTAEIEKNPRQPELFLRRGSLHRSHQDWAAALADFDRAQLLDPSLKIVDLARGELLTEMARFPEAGEALARYRDSFPTDGRVWAALGRLDAQQLKWEAAAGHYAKAVQCTQPPEPHLVLLQVQALRSCERLTEAIEALDAGVALLGPLPVLVQPAIEIEVERKQWDAALVRIDSTLKTAVRKERWLVKRGEVLELAGRGADALAAYRGALAEFETLPPGRRAVAAMVAFEENLRRAMKRLEGHAAANPGITAE